MPVSAEDWKSTEMIRAENELHDAVERAEQRIAEADELMTEQAERADEELTSAEALTTYAERPTAPAALRTAIHDVLSGLRSREDALADPAIAGDPLLMAALEMVTRPGTRPRPGAPRVGYDEEDFSTHSIMRNE